MASFGCIRHLLCCINLTFWILGCGVFGVGLWLHLLNEKYSTLASSYHILSTGGLMITAGTLTILLGFFGCCGAWFQNKTLLRAYFTLVVIVLLLELAVGTLGFIYRRNIGTLLQEELLAGIQKRYSLDNRHGLKEMWDQVQTQFECCGVRGYEDWYEISAWPRKKWVPPACCLPQYANSTSCGHRLKTSHWYSAGCYPKLHSWLMQRMYVVGIVCLSFAFVQLFGIIASLLLVCSLGKKKR